MAWFLFIATLDTTLTEYPIYSFVHVRGSRLLLRLTHAIVGDFAQREWGLVFALATLSGVLRVSVTCRRENGKRALLRR